MIQDQHHRSKISAASQAFSPTDAAQSDFPEGVPRPKWLLSPYHSEHWLTTGSRPAAPYKISFDVIMSDGSVLTDPQHAHLLDTVRRMSIGIRTGPHSKVTDPQVHMAMTNHMINWVLWMELNGIRRFANLAKPDLEAYIERAVYGVGYLLNQPERVRNLIKDMRESGTAMPRHGRMLDLKRLLESAIDPRRATHDRASLYEILKEVLKEGLYLKPRFLSILDTGPGIPTRVSQVHLSRLLQPWELQWQMRRTLPGDKIAFDPFPFETLAKAASKLGMTSSRTKTVPIEQAMYLIDRSIRWVLDYSSWILEIIRKADVVAGSNRADSPRRQRTKLVSILTGIQVSQGPGQPWPMKPRLTSNLHKDIRTFTSTLRCLFASCFVVIAAFTARRRNEVTSCREKGLNNEHCISSDNEGYWIELWIEKTVQQWDKTPCPEVVVKAIEVLSKLSATARTTNGRSELFQYKRLGLNKTALFRVHKGLRELTNHLDIPPLADGSKWSFSPRQFRRFFAIMYIWRYEFGELSALSYQLRHYNLDMTRRYITEPTQGKIFREVQTQHAVSILKEVALGRRDGSGPFGERFKKIAEKIRSQMINTVHVFTEEKFAERIERLILRSGKVLKGFPWGYCTCGSSSRDLGQAKCLNGADAAEARGPDKTKATLLTCANCPHHFTHEAFRPYAATQIEFHKKVSQDKNNGHLVRNASATFSKQLREYVNRSFKRSATVRSEDAQENEKPSPSNRTSKSKRRSSKDQRKDCGPSKIFEKRSA